MIFLTRFEVAVVQRLLSGPEEPVGVLRRQLEVAIPVHREQTPTGFYIDFFVSSNVEAVTNNASFAFGDVTAQIDGLMFGAGFLVHVKDGFLSQIEGFSYGEEWPGNVSSYTLAIDENLAERKQDTLREVLRH